MKHTTGIKVWEWNGKWSWWAYCQDCGARDDYKTAAEYDQATAWAKGHAAKGDRR